jgi:hypothetical protein
MLFFKERRLNSDEKWKIQYKYSRFPNLWYMDNKKTLNYVLSFIISWCIFQNNGTRSEKVKKINGLFNKSWKKSKWSLQLKFDMYRRKTVNFWILAGSGLNDEATLCWRLESISDFDAMRACVGRSSEHTRGRTDRSTGLKIPPIKWLHLDHMERFVDNFGRQFEQDGGIMIQDILRVHRNNRVVDHWKDFQIDPRFMPPQAARFLFSLDNNLFALTKRRIEI